MNKQLSIEDVVTQIKEIELKNLSPGSRGLEAWYDIRFNLYYMITNELGIFEEAHTKAKLNVTTLVDKVNLKLTSFYRKVFRNPFILFFNSKEYLFIGHPRRKLEEDNLFWDVYTDPITTDVLYKKTMTIEKMYNNKHYRPAPTKKLFYSEGFDLVRNLFIPENKIVVPTEVTETLKNMEAEINFRFETEINILDIGIKRYKSNKSRQGIARAFLKLLKPRILFLVCSYGLEYFVRAAKELRIPTVELQHGVINNIHLGYSFNKSLRKQSFPDYFFAFGTYWKEVVDFPIEKDNIYCIGFPYLENKIKHYNTKKNKKQIVFISQGTLGYRLSCFAAEFALKHPDFKVYYKLHPGEVTRWREEYTQLKDADYNGALSVIDGQSPSLYELLSESEIQVGVHSTALFEGLRFQCKTFLVDLPGIEYMRDFIKEGYGIRISHPDQLANYCESEKNSYNFENIFKPNWKDNFNFALSNILETAHTK